MRELIWYAAYGSNLDRARFSCYLRGGRPVGSRRAYRGCRDPREPLADVPATLPFSLYFGGESATWGGGSAFLDTGSGDGARTYVRLYLLSWAQLEDVVAQENGAPAARLTAVGRATRSYIAGPAAEHGTVPGGGSWKYGAVVVCGELDGRPIATVTAPAACRPEIAAPSAAYLRTIARGLRQSHGMSPGGIADYLLGKAGVSGRWSRPRLRQLATQHEHGTVDGPPLLMRIAQSTGSV